MSTLIALSGSLRRASFNTALLRAAASLAPAGVTVDVRTLHGIPVYDGDDEARGVPEAVTELRAAIKAADGVLIGCPEYNNSFSGVLKNGLDWLSRPSGEGTKTFGGKPVAVMGGTPGNGGTLLGQNALLPVLRTFGADPWWGGRLTVSQIHKLFDEQGTLVDAALTEQVRGFMAGFVAHLRVRVQ
ncbi:MAG: NAD(P)H-dependent oxidoreductase [Pelomonas sp.]|nr:NAD(P)H-dependent oxidoreductase [Burkholderiaceae bacterium]MBV8605062.1 NAD(P)H-dependent oxidoreductase [Roseateles sp.]